MNICLLDYGLGNIWSLKSSIEHIGCKVNFFSEINKTSKIDCLILPGVGSFYHATKLLNKKKIKIFLEEIVKNDIPLIGICLGMQILMTKGYEEKESKGLSLIKGNVKKIPIKMDEKLPNIGWRRVNFVKEENAKFGFLKKFDNEKFYFVHSFQSNPTDKSNVMGTSQFYDKQINSVIADKKKNIIGFQFHPEKSGEIGLSLLEELFKSFK